jgi:hypothetical protein
VHKRKLGISKAFRYVPNLQYTQSEQLMRPRINTYNAGEDKKLREFKTHTDKHDLAQRKIAIPPGGRKKDCFQRQDSHHEGCGDEIAQRPHISIRSQTEAKDTICKKKKEENVESYVN